MAASMEDRTVSQPLNGKSALIAGMSGRLVGRTAAGMPRCEAGLEGASLVGVPHGSRLRDADKHARSASHRGVGEFGLRGRALPLDRAVDRGTADAEELGDLEGAVLAAVDKGHEVRFLLAAELGLLPL